MNKNLIIILLTFLLIFITQCKKAANINARNPSQDGLSMSEEQFNEQLKRILNERKLKPKKKITKDILKEIFTELYKNDFVVNANLHVDENPNLNAQEEANKFMNDIFSILTRGIDSDQKIPCCNNPPSACRILHRQCRFSVSASADSWHAYESFSSAS